MARKKRNLPGGKRKNSNTKKTWKHASASVRRKSRLPVTKARRRKPRPKSIGDQISNTYRAVVDTIEETDRLRNKPEPPATSETE